MCNEAARRTALGLMRDDFRAVRIELTFPEGLPNLGESLSIRITDATVIVRAAGNTFEMVQRRWSWVGASSGKGAGKPVYNYRSEGRDFRNTGRQGRCLIPLDGFYEFTDPAPGSRLKTKWLFSLKELDGSAGEPDEHRRLLHKVWPPGTAARPAPGLFCVAGLWRGGADLGKGMTGEAFTMLTCEPGPDIAPYHGRQVVIMPRERWADWLGGAVPAADLIAPTPAGTLTVEPAR